jgi:hypothetical protein
MPYNYSALEEILAVPYTISVEAVRELNGTWVCQVSHPELPNCVARHRSPIVAMDQLDRARVNYLKACYIADGRVSSPRPTLSRSASSPVG